MSITEITDSIIAALKQTSIAEWCIFAAALLYVVLIAVEISIGWLFGIIASAISVYLCYSGNLYLESGLNIFYVVIGIYGWYQWKFGSKEHKEIAIVSYGLRQNLLLFAIGILVWIPFGFAAGKYSNQALPYLDAFITAFSLIATWMTTKKIIENWLYWIVIDALGVILFAYREFYLLALLNVIYCIIAFAGYLKWRKSLTTS